MDARPMTPLAAAVLARFGNSGEVIADFAKTARPTDFASLFPIVLEHAERGDPLGLDLMREAADDAARMILGYSITVRRPSASLAASPRS